MRVLDLFIIIPNVIKEIANLKCRLNLEILGQNKARFKIELVKTFFVIVIAKL